ncbi:MAG: hypothetical protein KJ955_05090 [Nanoarchaeota archaeon]|nr:hypothetical protein [Nanoarchaeota archaeon]
MEKGIFEEQKHLVLERFKTLNPEAKIMLGDGKELTVRDLIGHIIREDEFGRKAVHVQIRMLRVLAGGS